MTVFWVLHSTSHSDPTRRRLLKFPNWKQHCTLPSYGLYTSKIIKLLPLFWANEHLREMNLFTLDDTQLFLHWSWDQRVSSEQGIELSSKSHKKCNIRFFLKWKIWCGADIFLIIIMTAEIVNTPISSECLWGKMSIMLKDFSSFPSTPSYTCRNTG